MLPQGPLAYLEDGEGPPVLFLHGVLANALLWRRVMGQLPGFRKIAPHLPLGSHPLPLAARADLSPDGLARLVLDFMDALNLPEATLVANDTGGAVAQLLATHFPERVTRLVLTNCDAFSNFLPPLFRYLQAAGHVPASLGLIPLLARVPRLQRLPFTYGHLARRLPPQEVMRAYLMPSRDPGVRRDLGKVLRGIHPSVTERAARALPAFTHPALIVWAQEDRHFPIEHAEALARLLPNSRLVRVPDSLTFLPEDQPDVLAAHLHAFLTQTAG